MSSAGSLPVLPRSMTRLVLGLLPLALLCVAADGGGCSSSAAQVGGACAAAGGQCFLGGHECPAIDVAPASANDCNPDENPGGAFCCLSKASTSTPDASVGDAAPGDASLPACSWLAIYDPTDASSERGQCVAARVYLSCSGSNGGGEDCMSNDPMHCPGPDLTPGVTYSNCQNQCRSDEYALGCGGPGPGPWPQPPATCRSLLAGPGGGTSACCPCTL
jgi:hypothetical protein